MTERRQGCKPIPKLIEGLNRHLKGWRNYFDFGYPRVAFREINWYVGDRLTQHLRRRSQRPFRPPEGVSSTSNSSDLGWYVPEGWQPCNCLRMPETRRFQESRMREICMSGSTRGEWVAPQGVALSPTLLQDLSLNDRPQNAMVCPTGRKWLRLVNPLWVGFLCTLVQCAQGTSQGGRSH